MNPENMLAELISSDYTVQINKDVLCLYFEGSFEGNYKHDNTPASILSALTRAWAGERPDTVTPSGTW